MDPKVYFCDSTVERLTSAAREATEPFSGLLVGLKDDQSRLILGHYSFEQAHPKHFVKQFKAATSLLPIGYHVFGYFFKSPQSRSVVAIRNLCKKIFPHGSAQQKCFNSESILICVLDEGQQFTPSLYHFDALPQALGFPAELSLATKEQLRSTCDRYVMCHLRANLPFSFHDSDDPGERKESVERYMAGLGHWLCGPLVCLKVVSSSAAAPLDSSRPPLLLSFPEEGGDDCEAVEKMRRHFGLGGSRGRAARQRTGRAKGAEERKEEEKEGEDGSGDLFHDFLTFDVLTKMTNISPEDETGVLSCVPVLHHDHMECTLVKMDLPLDVLVLLDITEREKKEDDDNEEEDDDYDDDDDDEDSTRRFEDLFKEAVRKQLLNFSDFIINLDKDSRGHVPRPHHFKVPHSNLIITAIYPEGVDEKELEPVRKELHDRFLVAPVSPVFKRFNALQPEAQKDVRNDSGFLLDVHLGLPASKAKGEVNLVKGSYQYRHYMQDRTDDSGWGCAYRSLQTIASWLLLQGFTDRAPPTHLEIQQALVDVGDKPVKFVNSKQWIGSTEVSYVLDHLYGVQSKISHASSGDEMTSKAREIAHHFKTQGTPIMIGGGLLAHTILGIDFNETTGDTNYLVLDPHYTGPEDLRTIQAKGWCGWKGPEFWKAGSFYNMCMPIRPIGF